MPAEARFRHALDQILTGQHQPQVHFQPIVDLQRGRVVGYEALARFPAPPQLGPDEWFRGAHARGKRVPLELITSQMAMASRFLLPPETFLTVNVSPVFLLSDEFSTLLNAERDLHRIVLEITEEERVRDYAELRNILARVREMGGTIAVDDTGSGYASLKQVMELRPQFVKLDRFFITGCEHDPAKSALIQMIGEAADRMDAWLVAEGIETENEMFELIRHRVPLGQGYLLGRPAAHMATLRTDLAALIHQRNNMTATDGLKAHLEVATVYSDLETAQAAVSSGVCPGCAVVVDRNGRPLQLLEVHPLAGFRTLQTPMLVQVGSNVPDVLRRALSRPIAQRFDPLVAISECGEYLGLIRVDTLTHSLMPPN